MFSFLFQLCQNQANISHERMNKPTHCIYYSILLHTIWTANHQNEVFIYVWQAAFVEVKIKLMTTCFFFFFEKEILPNWFVRGAFWRLLWQNSSRSRNQSEMINWRSITTPLYSALSTILSALTRTFSPIIFFFFYFTNCQRDQSNLGLGLVQFLFY